MPPVFKKIKLNHFIGSQNWGIWVSMASYNMAIFLRYIKYKFLIAFSPWFSQYQLYPNHDSKGAATGSHNFFILTASWKPKCL